MVLGGLQLEQIFPIPCVSFYLLDALGGRHKNVNQRRAMTSLSREPDAGCHLSAPLIGQG